MTRRPRGKPVVHYALTPRVRRSLVQRHARVGAHLLRGRRGAGPRAGARKSVIEAAEQDRIDDLIPLDGFKAGKISVSSAHLMGGCRMGAGDADSVTDAWGRVHGVPWLFVADASLFPRSAEINPYITIMALADRVAEIACARSLLADLRR